MVGARLVVVGAVGARVPWRGGEGGCLCVWTPRRCCQLPVNMQTNQKKSKKIQNQFRKIAWNGRERHWVVWICRGLPFSQKWMNFTSFAWWHLPTFIRLHVDSRIPGFVGKKKNTNGERYFWIVWFLFCRSLIPFLLATAVLYLHWVSKHDRNR